MIEKAQPDPINRIVAADLLMIGFEGPRVDRFIEQAVREWRVGGVILFDRNIQNPAQVASLCRALQTIRSEVSDLPLLIAADQEGGTVVRFREGVDVFPGNRALAEGGDERTAYLQGRATGRDLRELGINLNLAPVLDLYTPSSNRSVGLRSFGPDPERAARLGRELIRGMQDEGVAACAKHFPGKGKAEVDSHRSLPVITRPAGELLSRDLLPFRKAVSAKVAAVMTSHAAYPRLDGGRIEPATFSLRISAELLRKRLSFSGVLITDDLGMGAIGESPAAAAEKAIRAGADIALLCHQPAAIGPTVEILRSLLNGDESFRKRWEESRGRIEKMKRKIRAGAPTLPEPPAGNDLPLRIARRAVKVVRDRGENLPLTGGGQICLIRFRPERTVEVEGAFEDRWNPETFLGEAGLRPTVEILPLSPDNGRPVPVAGPKKKMVICAYDARLYPGQKRMIKKLLKQNPAAILIILRDPADAAHFPEAGTVIVTYGYTPPSLWALAEVITGEEITARGLIAAIKRREEE